VERPAERRHDATPAIAAVVPIDAVDYAVAGDLAVKRDPAVDVLRDVHLSVHGCVHGCVPLAAANRGVGMGGERAAADRRAGAKCSLAAAKSAAVVTTAGAMPAASTTAPRR
jgi:hypothetical protein